GRRAAGAGGAEQRGAERRDQSGVDDGPDDDRAVRGEAIRGTRGCRCAGRARTGVGPVTFSRPLEKSAFIHSSELIKAFLAPRDVVVPHVSLRRLRHACSEIPPAVEPFEMFFNSLLGSGRAGFVQETAASLPWSTSRAEVSIKSAAA